MGFFGRKKEKIPPHPRTAVRVDLPLTPESVVAVFSGCADFARREVALGGGEKSVTLVYLVGMVKMERASDYLLRPMAQDAALGEGDWHAIMERMAAGGLYNLDVQRRTTMDEVVFDMIAGNCVLLFPGQTEALSFNVGTEEKRAISDPPNETPLKGPRDSFVEGIRTNTSLVRRRIRTPSLRIREILVGRQSVTPVDLIYIDGITNPEIVVTAARRVADIDIDALIATGNLEEYIVDDLNTAFPLVAYTERPDRFSAGVVEGRVGILVDGLPLGYLVPGTIGQFFKTPEDKSSNWMSASFLAVLRYICMFATLLLPAIYIAAVTFHPEMLPTRLALSIIAAKRDVPFTTIFEVLIMLLAFELVQEAGLRLPQSIGQTVSILGGLVVGTAAVEARIVSPAVLIVVAMAGIAGYTMPSQDFAAALRIWRFVLALAASIAGLLGVMVGLAALIIHLAGLESFGVSYLTPFAANAGKQIEGGAVLRHPMPKTKLRDISLKTQNRRNQG